MDATLARRGPNSSALPPLQQFVEDELLRMPMLFDQLLQSIQQSIRSGEMAGQTAGQRVAASDAVTASKRHRDGMAEYFMNSIRQQIHAEIEERTQRASGKISRPMQLSLVEEESVAVDVELSHCIEMIKSVAEHELRELQTFTASLIGDMDMSQDHNPFKPEVYARATWAAANALPLSRSHQVQFMRQAARPLGEVLRRSFAASATRLEAMGVEPAAYRTLILPGGSRQAQRNEITFSPDLNSVRDAMPMKPGPGTTAPLSEPGKVARELRGPRSHDMAGLRDPQSAVAPAVDKRAVELVSRLFAAMAEDRRVPGDVAASIARLRVPAMKLAASDASLTDHEKHPLWRFVNQFVYAAEMSPEAADPERSHLMRTVKSTIEQLEREPQQLGRLYDWALDRLDSYLQKRLLRRLSTFGGHILSLQKLEDKLEVGNTLPTTMHGALDVPQLDTVPAVLMELESVNKPELSAAQDWMNQLKPGDWVRLFLNGKWCQAQLLWPGERRQIWLFGDGASDATWAIRRGALLMMFSAGLMKTLKQRSIVGSAATRVQAALTAA